jgi:hypothetical protein
MMDEDNNPERLKKTLIMHGLSNEQIDVVLRSYRSGLEIMNK